MTASAKGDADNPGKNVKAKAGLNREMLSNGQQPFKSPVAVKARSARKGAPAY